MVLFIFMGIVIVIALGVMVFLFFTLSKEGVKEEDKAVPVTDVGQLKKDVASHLFEQNDPKNILKDPEIMPVMTTKVPLSTPEAQYSLEDEKYKKRAQQLEDELLAIAKKADGQTEESRQLIETLTKENEALKSQKADLEKSQQALNEAQAEASNLKVENLQLVSQLDSTNAKVRLLEEEMATLKVQMGEEISRANATIAELTVERQALLAAPKPEPDESLRHELESLKAELVLLNQKCEDLEKANQDLKYEHIKAKAQSSGLERVSFNYKNQLEDFFKKINSMQVNNEQLSQVKNRLEGIIEEVKSQNEDLVKKDQLAQFELEKNRSRLANLEREYEDFKARAQQQNQ